MIIAFAEIKNRICLLCLTFLSIILSIYYYKLFLVILIIISNSLLSYEILNYFIFTNITEIIYMYVLLSFFIAKHTLYFALIYHLTCFLSSGLLRIEYLYIKFVFLLCIIFTVISTNFFYKIFIPTITSFFFNFQNNTTTHQTVAFYFEAKIYDYLKFFIEAYFTCFFCFQSCVVLFIFSIFVSKNFKILKRTRKFFYIIFLLFSTLVTPPDIISQIILYLLFVSIFEINIFINVYIKMITKFN